MKGSYLISLIMVFVLMSCGTNTSKNITEQQQREFTQLMDSNEFEIVFISAQPMASQGLQAVANAGLLAPGSNLARIDLIGTANYLRRVGDSVSASLPYYGERQIGGAYNNSEEVGINFKGTPTDISLVKNEKNGSYKMNYTIKNKTETFIVNSVLFPNKTVSTTISSSHRRTISYRGKVSSISG